jgi:hypothetical protein
MAYSMADDADLRARARKLREAVPTASADQVAALRAYAAGATVNELRMWTLLSSGFVSDTGGLTMRGERLLAAQVSS